MFPNEDMPPSVPPPSGIVGAITPNLISGVALLSVFPGESCDTILFVYSGLFVKIFEGVNGTYLFNTPSGVIFSSDYDSWRSVASFANSITQIDSSKITVLFKNTSDIKSLVYAQKFPETYNGWTLQTTLSGTQVSDSAGSPDSVLTSVLPILAGNNRANTFSRITRNEIRTLPIGSFLDSDAGIPQTSPTIAQITDLEAV